VRSAIAAGIKLLAGTGGEQQTWAVTGHNEHRLLEHDRGFTRAGRALGRKWYTCLSRPRGMAYERQTLPKPHNCQEGKPVACVWNGSDRCAAQPLPGVEKATAAVGWSGSRGRRPVRVKAQIVFLRMHPSRLGVETHMTSVSAGRSGVVDLGEGAPPTHPYRGNQGIPGRCGL
jgi:hypothetical protein